ncbi:MltA domain-containing protein [Zavarzinia compransoris]|uniref:murein transglycosylase A n=1 Tax=Zavarzinia marina TaxID=2911065 RepID=UPI001F2D19B7|nr:MltA domain-containing protein [Zavarzinia marina]MCF4166836.1 MltA domain-containing protein [Zavarzinia marina]
MARRSPLPALAAGAVAVAAALAVALCLAPEHAAPPAPPDRLVLIPAGFADLPGWDEDRLDEAWPAFRLSCARLLRRKPETGLGIAGTVADWTPACTEAQAIEAPDAALVRRFLEDRFRPVQALNGDAAEGLFTGYYEPELLGARKADAVNRTPLYRRPDDLVQVDLGAFSPDFKGRRVAGRVVDGHLKPYEDRAAITAGALDGKGLELAWVASPVDAFFLEIQGSGRVRFADGGIMRVGYAGQNGHAYVALGKVMIEDGMLERGKVTLQSIKDWLNGHPDQAAALMNRNPSYVFFRDLGDGAGPIGAQGVALTPGRSLAVDRKFYPMGVPVWLDATLPPAGDEAPAPYRRLMVAQDTGGAIRGPVRGDVFFGAGAEAERLAGAMKQQGRLWFLLPAPVAAALAEPAS